jgi:hypothetical protein
MITHRLTRSAAIVVAIGALTAPAADAGPAERRSVDAAITSVDLRSPDARDAARTAATGQDLRSPDARDAATTAVRMGALTPSVLPAATPGTDGSAWDEVAIIGGGAAALLLAVSLAFVAPRRRTVGHGTGRPAV